LINTVPYIQFLII